MKVTPLWREDYFISIDQIRDICEKRFKLEKLDRPDYSPAEYYKIEGGGRLGFIKTDVTNCERCTRLRLTSTGELKICLYERDGLCLKSFLRNGASPEKIRDIIGEKIGIKQKTDYRDYESEKLYMCSIGG